MKVDGMKSRCSLHCVSGAVNGILNWTVNISFILRIALSHRFVGCVWRGPAWRAIISTIITISMVTHRSVEPEAES